MTTTKKGPGKAFRKGMSVAEFFQMFPDHDAAEKWLVATVGTRLSRRYKRIACASADPSWGSVPAPSSSKSTSERSSASSRMGVIFERCDENVERLCSMLCSSPMSA